MHFTLFGKDAVNGVAKFNIRMGRLAVFDREPCSLLGQLLLLLIGEALLVAGELISLGWVAEGVPDDIVDRQLGGGRGRRSAAEVAQLDVPAVPGAGAPLRLLSGIGIAISRRRRHRRRGILRLGSFVVGHGGSRHPTSGLRRTPRDGKGRPTRDARGNAICAGRQGQICKLAMAR